jgi:hypothetical protein
VYVRSTDGYAKQGDFFHFFEVFEVFEVVGWREMRSKRLREEGEALGSAPQCFLQ